MQLVSAYAQPYRETSRTLAVLSIHYTCYRFARRPFIHELQKKRAQDGTLSWISLKSLLCQWKFLNIFQGYFYPTWYNFILMNSQLSLKVLQPQTTMRLWCVWSLAHREGRLETVPPCGLSLLAALQI